MVLLPWLSSDDVVQRTMLMENRVTAGPKKCSCKSQLVNYCSCSGALAESKSTHLIIFVVVVQSFSCGRLFVTPWTAARQASLFFANSNSCPLSQWCHPTTLPSIVPFPSCLQSFPASGSFPMSQFFALGSKELIGSSCCISHSQESSPALQFKASSLQLSAFFIVQLSHPYWLLEKP